MRLLKRSSKSPTPCKRKTPDASNNITFLDVDGVLAWRTLYEDLFGKSRDAVIERYGLPSKEKDEDLTYAGSAKTGYRGVEFGILDHRVFAIKVYARPLDYLPIDHLVEKSQLFCFRSGSYRDSADTFFDASTKDGRDTFQFSTTDSYVKFYSVMFFDYGTPCNPTSFAPTAH